jgi:LPS-assembly protein
MHSQRSIDKIGGYLNINLINEENYYREFNPNIEFRAGRFLDSTGEINIPFKNSRGYLLTQYWIDLKDNSEKPAQKLPEAGYVLHPVKVGPLLFSGEATLSNFWRSEGVDGQRVDIFPKILHSFGSDIVISQSIGLRETAYNLNRAEDETLQRESFEYDIVANTRLIKKYTSFTHVVEPSLSYTLITNSENNLPVFDMTEIYRKTSFIELALLNRFISRNGEFLVFRASQGFDSYLGDRSFLPFKLEIGLKKPLSVKLDASYNVHTGQLEGINSEISGTISRISLYGGQRYNRENDIAYYQGGVQINPFKPFFIGGRIWYDAKEQEIRETSVNLKYIGQCWGISLDFINRPGDFNVLVLLELTGITRSIRS